MVTKEQLEVLGITPESIRQDVVERICDLLLTTVGSDEHGRECKYASQFDHELRGVATQAVKNEVQRIADEHIVPDVRKRIDELILQKTNCYGETTSKPYTFREYLVTMAEEYLTEKVSYDGKSKDEARGFSWQGRQTRLTHIVHEYMHYDIEKAMKAAVQNANTVIAEGIREAVKIKLGEITKSLQLSVKV